MASFLASPYACLKPLISNRTGWVPRTHFHTCLMMGATDRCPLRFVAPTSRGRWNQPAAAHPPSQARRPRHKYSVGTRKRASSIHLHIRQAGRSRMYECVNLARFLVHSERGTHRGEAWHRYGSRVTAWPTELRSTSPRGRRSRSCWRTAATRTRRSRSRPPRSPGGRDPHGRRPVTSSRCLGSDTG